MAPAKGTLNPELCVCEQRDEIRQQRQHEIKEANGMFELKATELRSRHATEVDDMTANFETAAAEVPHAAAAAAAAAEVHPAAAEAAEAGR